MIYISLSLLVTGFLWLLVSFSCVTGGSKNSDPGIPYANRQENFQAGYNKINPWFSIWFKPGITLRFILLDDSELTRIFLVCLGAFAVISPFDPETATLFAIGNSNSPDIPHSYFQAVLISAPIRGLLGLYLGAAFIKWTGGLFKGKAKFQEIESAIAWSNIPIIFTVILWIPEMLNSLKNIPIPYFPYLIIGARFIIITWALIIFIIFLSEVQEYTVWKSILNILTAILALAICLTIFLGIIYLVQYVSGFQIIEKLGDQRNLPIFR